MDVGVIIAGVVSFVSVILALVAILSFAKSKLVSSEAVTIGINGDPTKALKTQAGATLLDTLSNNKLFIPSACGGKGSCGVCKVNVHDGGGAMLPTEKGHISRGEEREGCRLACQVKVKADMEIELEADVFSIQKWDCKVRSNHKLRRLSEPLSPQGEMFRLVLRASRSKVQRTESSTRTSISKKNTTKTGTSLISGSLSLMLKSP